MDIIPSATANVAATPLIAAGSSSRIAAILGAGHDLLPHLTRGRSIDPADLRPPMTHVAGGRHVVGSWSWEGAFEATETAKVLVLCMFGTTIARTNAPEAALGLHLIDVTSLK
ncbi:hypothetical protein EHS39_18510 [Ensifer sp. MPMI2T]|nr:hypothetical protein EHS39_18510 [Ensifer sp. MPMI2T]